MFDVTRSESFRAVEKWKVDLDSKVLLPDGRPIPCILLGNKSDMDASLHASRTTKRSGNATYSSDQTIGLTSLSPCVKHTYVMF